MQTILVLPPNLPQRFEVIGQNIICSSDQMPMTYIAAGIFNMGSEEFLSSKPIHQVYLSDYLMDIHLVTNAQYRLFVEAEGYKNSFYWSKLGWSIRCEEQWEKPRYWGYPPWDIPLHPVVGISFFEAQAYSSWAGKTLPTEAQWEKAARGGIWLDGDNSAKILNPLPLRRYPWGNDEPKNYAIYKDEPQYGNRSTGPVGIFQPGASPYGCLDMSGNVWEWCQDWYQRDYYLKSPSQNPTGPIIDEDSSQAIEYSKILRGGSWCRDARQLNISFRTKDDPRSGGWDLSGFRCAKLLV